MHAIINELNHHNPLTIVKVGSWLLPMVQVINSLICYSGSDKVVGSQFYYGTNVFPTGSTTAYSKERSWVRIKVPSCYLSIIS